MKYKEMNEIIEHLKAEKMNGYTIEDDTILITNNTRDYNTKYKYEIFYKRDLIFWNVKGEITFLKNIKELKDFLKNKNL